MCIHRLSRIGLFLSLIGFGIGGPRGIFGDERVVLRARSPYIETIRIVLTNGARPRFAPSGDRLVFDRQNSDGYYDLYLCDLNGRITAALTEGASGIEQKNNGNGVFDPTGRYVAFVSETARHLRAEISYYGDPGLGLYCNLWAIELANERFTPLTDVPIKRTLFDGLPSWGVVNPHFSQDGHTLIWTERYDEREDLNRRARRARPVHWGWMEADGSRKERLTFFNDSSAPEYLACHAIVAAADISPDGRYLAGTLGVDRGAARRRIALQVILIEFKTPY